MPQFATRKATLSAADFSKTVNLAEVAVKEGAAAAARARPQPSTTVTRKKAWNAGSGLASSTRSPLQQSQARASKLEVDNASLRVQLASAQSAQGDEHLHDLEHSMQRLANSVGELGKRDTVAKATKRKKLKKKSTSSGKRKARAASARADAKTVANDEQITHQVADRLRDLFQLDST